jgi:DNA-binding winged helix-turn-helix (wHTH) protein
LRPAAEYESFYALFTRSVQGLPPYTGDDARRIVSEVQARRSLALDDDVIDAVIAHSGGHAGLIIALCDALAKTPDLAPDAWHTQPAVRDMCQRLWGSLSEREQLALSQVALGYAVADAPTASMLQLKWLLRPHEAGTNSRLFSPLFEHFVRAHGVVGGQALSVDERAHVVWAGGQRIDGLTAREFDLLALLARKPGEVHDRRDILQALNPGLDYTETLDNAVDALVKRVRRKIEPTPGYPRYLVSVRGKGYKLIPSPDAPDTTRMRKSNPS